MEIKFPLFQKTWSLKSPSIERLKLRVVFWKVGAVLLLISRERCYPKHCVKSVRIRSYSVRIFPHSDWITPNMDTSYALNCHILSKTRKDWKTRWIWKPTQTIKNHHAGKLKIYDGLTGGCIVYWKLKRL